MPVPNLDLVVSEIADEMRQRPDRGEVATYIPELARVDPKAFGLVVIDADGNVAAGGDADTPFSIQSISKVFTLTLALGKVGDGLWQRVGREPSGSPFNSIVQLEFEHGMPRNPFINAGAIAVTDRSCPAISRARRSARSCGSCGFSPTMPSISIDEAVAASEQRTGFRNVALANYMKSFGVLENPGGAHARRLFPPLRHRHVLPAARHGRALSRPWRAQSDRPACRWSRPSARGASTR